MELGLGVLLPVKTGAIDGRKRVKIKQIKFLQGSAGIGYVEADSME